MKHLQAILFLLLLAPATNTYAQVQTLVNQLWLDTTGHPVQNSYFQTARRDGSYVYVAGSSYHQGQSANVLITKYSTTGTKIWQKEYNTTSDNTDLVTDMYVKGNYYYATGTMWDSVNSRSNIFILKGSIATGDTVWLRIYSGSYSGYHAGASILPDNNGNVYVGGAEQASSSNFRMLAIKYDSAGTQLWASNYDSAGYYDAIVSMGIDAAKNYLTITGFSGSGFANWDFVTTAFNLTTGVRHHVVSRSSNGNGSFSQPVGIGKDYSDNTFIAGTSAINAYNTDIKIIKYDTLFNEVWVRRWGKSDSLKDEATAFAQDVNANLLLTGYTTGTGGAKSMLVLKYSTGGTLLWSRTIAAPNPANNCTGKDIVADDSSNVYVTGSVNNGLNNDIITVCYDKNGKLIWQQIYNSDENTIDDGYDVLVDNQHKVYVSGRSALASPRFVTICYDYLQLSNQAYLDANDIPVYLKNQLIIKFNKNAIKSSAVNKKGLNFGNLDAFLESWAVDSLLRQLPYDQKYYKLGRIFHGLKTTDTISISRLGERIPVPDFWSTFLLIFTAPVSEKQLCDTLNQLFPFVETAELDLIMESNSIVPNDPYYSNLQLSLHPSVDYPNAGINVEEAWQYTTGKPHIRVGVFDSGIDKEHLDFSADGGTTSTASVVKGGYDYLSGIAIFGYDPQGHGTACAGIIGACRNNNFGIAGIAGGDTINSAGVTLYNMRILRDYDETPPIPSVFASVHNYLDAVIHSSVDLADSTYSFRINITNNSYGFSGIQGTAPYVIDSNVALIKDVLHFANRNKMAIVFGSGNDRTGEIDSILPYPANIDDDWLLVVGGTGGDGNNKMYYDLNDAVLWQSKIGDGLDVSAPSTSYLVYTLATNGQTTPFWGTSAAAPHVTGVASLLYSYLNDTMASYKNLAPEDIEYIIQRSAFNIDSDGYDICTGWGRLNAGGALSIVDTSKRKLIHFDSDSISSNTNTWTQIDTNTIILLTEKAVSKSNQLFKAGNYNTDVYRINTIVDHPLLLTDTIVAAWVRNSSSETYPYYDEMNKLIPHEKTQITLINNQQAYIAGYIYHLKDSLNQSIGWLPFDTTYALQANFAYSVLVGDSIYAPWDTLINNIQYIQKLGVIMAVYPSPSSEKQTLSISIEENWSNTSILMFDLSGKLIKSVFNGNLTKGSSNFQIDVSDVPNGMYVFTILSDKGKYYLKSIKQ